MNSKLVTIFIVALWAAFTASFLPGCTHVPAGRYVFVAGTPEDAEAAALRVTGRCAQATPDGETWRAEVVIR